MPLFKQQFILDKTMENCSVNKMEITAVRTFDFQDATWMSTSSLCEKAYRFINAKTYLFSDSVLCVGKMGDDPIKSKN